MICKKCGASLPEDCKFCIACGASLKEQQAEAPAAAPAEDASAGAGSEFGSVPEAPDFMHGDTAPAEPKKMEPELNLDSEEIPAPELVLPQVEADPVEGVPEAKPEIDLILPDTLEELKGVTEEAAQTSAQPEAPAEPKEAPAPETAPAQPEAAPAQPEAAPAEEPAQNSEPVRPRPMYARNNVGYQAADPEEEPEHQPEQPARPEPIYARGGNGAGTHGPAEAKPPRPKPVEQSGEVLSMWQWLLCIVLAMIPIVNIVMLCIWGFGSETNPNKRNWARAMLISVAIGIVLAIIGVVINVVIFAALLFA